MLLNNLLPPSATSRQMLLGQQTFSAVEPCCIPLSCVHTPVCHLCHWYSQCGVLDEHLRGSHPSCWGAPGTAGIAVVARCKDAAAQLCGSTQGLRPAQRGIWLSTCSILTAQGYTTYATLEHQVVFHIACCWGSVSLVYLLRSYVQHSGLLRQPKQCSKDEDG
jgi:hypothetical protein